MMKLRIDDWIKKRILILVCLFLFQNEIFANPWSDEKIHDVYFDSGTFTIQENKKRIILEDKVLFLIGDIFISADKIIYSKVDRIAMAEGNVLIISGLEKTQAKSAILDLDDRQIRLEKVDIIAEPLSDNDLSKMKILGFTPSEIAFEAARYKRIQELNLELKNLREEYANTKRRLNLPDENSSEINNNLAKINKRYAQILERYSRTNYQPNAVLAGYPADVQTKFTQRRKAIDEFNRKNPEVSKLLLKTKELKGFIHIQAERAYRLSNLEFKIEDATISACKCSALNEPTLWSFSCKKANIEVGDYLTMQGATVDVLSVPILYTPWLRLPIKNKREWGFLPPTAYVSRSGQLFSQPFFLTFGDSADATITYNSFSKRGHRFDGEFRLQLTPESKYYVFGHYIRDNTYRKEWSTKNQSISDEIEKDTTTPDDKNEKILKSFKGKDIPARWYIENSFNSTLYQRIGFKSEIQAVSDSKYLSDYSAKSINANPFLNLSGNTFARRFLHQEAALEYYGDNEVVSLQFRGKNDLFSNENKLAPLKMPKLNIELLPRPLFNSPFIFENHSSWEYVKNYPKSSYLSLLSSSPGPFPDEALSSTHLDNGPAGKRLFITTGLTYPIKSNRFFNSHLSVRNTYVEYDLDTQKNHASLMHNNYSVFIDLPLFTKLNLNKNEKDSSLIEYRNNITPFAEFKLTPPVTRSENYPSLQELYYASDNVASGQFLNLGVSFQMFIKKEGTVETERYLERFSANQIPEIANTQHLVKIIEKRKLKYGLSPNEIFELTKKEIAPEVFDEWANLELEDYARIVQTLEFSQPLYWPNQPVYTKTKLWEYKPIQLKVSSSYNFAAKETAKEINKVREGSGLAPIKVQPFGDIISELSWNAVPIFELNGTLNSSYSLTYKRLNSFKHSYNIGPFYNTRLNYSNGYHLEINAAAPAQFKVIRTITAGVTHNPARWLEMGVQWKKVTDSASLADKNAPESYTSKLYVSFLKIQECFDLNFMRIKNAGDPERKAYYVVSLNLHFLDSSYQVNQIGNSLNRNRE